MAVKRVSWGEGEKKQEAWAATFYDADGNRHRKQGFNTRRAAEQWEREERATVEEAALRPNQKPIDVSTLCDQWLGVIEKGTGERKAVERGTLEDYELSVRLYIKPHLGDDLVADLTPGHIVDFRTKLLKTTTRKKAQRVLRHLRIVLNYAVQATFIQTNPAQTVKVIIDKREEEEVTIPSRAEMVQILSALDKEVEKEQGSGHKERPWLRFAALFRVLQGAGLRVSEARGLAWSSVDLDNAIITVRQRADRHGVVGRPKSAAAYRSVVIGPSVVTWLKRWKPHCPASEQGLVFPSRDGKPLLYSNMYKLWWKPLLTGIKMVKGGTPIYGFHSARHFRVSEKIAIGANVLDVRNEIGHANSSTTLDIYGHLFPEDVELKRKQAAEIETKLLG